jgi:hypothetical protein
MKKRLGSKDVDWTVATKTIFKITLFGYELDKLTLYMVLRRDPVDLVIIFRIL